MVPPTAAAAVATAAAAVAGAVEGGAWVQPFPGKALPPPLVATPLPPLFIKGCVCVDGWIPFGVGLQNDE